jgi:hypothetical protein
MTTLLITDYGAHRAGEIDMAGFIAIGTEVWRESPRRQDHEIRHGRLHESRYFSTWLGLEVDLCDEIVLCWLFDNWTEAERRGLGSEPRVCWWLS